MPARSVTEWDDPGLPNWAGRGQGGSAGMVQPESPVAAAHLVVSCSITPRDMLSSDVLRFVARLTSQVLHLVSTLLRDLHLVSGSRFGGPIKTGDTS